MFPANGKNVKLGKGSLLLAPLEADGSDRGYERVGNCSAIALTSDTQAEELYSSTQAAAGLVARNTTRVSYVLTATCEEFTIANIRNWLQGEVVDKVQGAGSAQTVTFENVKPGNIYDVGARRITNVSVMRDGTDDLLLNTDYSLSSEFGVIQILASGAVADGDDVTVEFDRPALVITQVRIAKAPAREARLLFLGDDSNSTGNAAKDRLEVWRAQLAPEGEFNFISDSYGNFQFSVALLADDQHPDDPYGSLERIEVQA